MRIRANRTEDSKLTDQYLEQAVRLPECKILDQSEQDG